MNLLGCLAAMVAMACAYLASPNQRLRARPAGKPVRVLAWLFAGAALVAWVAAETSLPGAFGALTAIMLGAIAFPYLTWLLRPAAPKKLR